MESPTPNNSARIQGAAESGTIGAPRRDPCPAIEERAVATQDPHSAICR